MSKSPQARTDPTPRSPRTRKIGSEPIDTGAESRNVRHALRTPINHLLGYCEMLLEEGEVPASFRRDLERIQVSGRQLLNLINEHFDQAQPRKEPQDLHRLYHDLRTPVNHVVGYCELLQEEAVEIGKRQFVPELQKIHDAAITWLALMEKNLNLSAQTGTGVISSPDPSAPRRDKSPPDQKRTRKWSAAVSKTSRSARNALNPPDFSAPAAAGRGRHSRAPLVGTEDTAGTEAGTLLIVDDDQDDRDLLARRFQHRGYTVAIAANGPEAIELTRARKFDLVLLDLVMPGMGGLEVLKRLRQKQSMTELPVIMLTAMDSTADVVEALLAGANDYLTKPAPFTVVQARARTHIRLKRAQSELKERMEEVQQLAGALEKRNRFIQQVFGRYLTDEVVQTLLETPEGLKLGGENREVTIVMSDLRGFTSMAEKLPPERVIEMLNLYLGEMTQIISRYEGVIDEFIGDAILIIFGAPIRKDDHPERAVACALSMQLAMPQVNERLTSLGVPRLAMGIGINTGQVVVGNIGSAKRAKYGVVGTPVNVTARIQSAAVAGQVLIADATASRVRSILSYREKKTLMAKGIAEALTLYDVSGLGGHYDLRLPSAG